MDISDKKNKLNFFILVAVDIAFVIIAVFLIAGPSFHLGNFALLNPKGTIALQERNLMFMAIGLMLLVAIPMFLITIFIIWRYRSSNTNANYSPNLQNKSAVIILWIIPIIVIFIMGMINWKSTHALDPYKPLNSNVKPITIQVVALRWKWLFIYPEQNIATVNFIEFPINTPVNFQLTSSGPMNSFWIPQLSGQMYAMAGMSTKLHMMADTPGEYNGSAAEINGAGLASMRFVAKSTSQADYDAWVKTTKQSSNVLNLNTYNELEKPSENNLKTFYSSVGQDLYNTIIMKFMAPNSDMQMEGMK